MAYTGSCKWCGDTFTAARSSRLYCGNNCNQRAYEHRTNCGDAETCTRHIRRAEGWASTPPLELLLRTLDRSGGPDSCWEWKGWRNRLGYGSAKVVQDGRQRTMQAHRAVYALSLGVELVPGMPLLHSCDNPPCCNPRHLRPGTQVENMADRKNHGAGYGQNGTPVDAETIAAIRAEYKFHTHGRGVPSLARKHNLPETTVNAIVKRAGRFGPGGCAADEKAAG